MSYNLKQIPVADRIFDKLIADNRSTSYDIQFSNASWNHAILDELLN